MTGPEPSDPARGAWWLEQDTIRALMAIDRADVYKAGRLAAHLSLTPDGGVEFGYTREWLRNRGAAIATTLPLRPAPVRGDRVPVFFAGLLPEGRRFQTLLGAVRRAGHGTGPGGRAGTPGPRAPLDLRPEQPPTPGEEFRLLLAVGSNTVGDVQVVPADHPPAWARPCLRGPDFAHFSQMSFTDLVTALGTQVDPVALPGVQDKVSAGLTHDACRVAKDGGEQHLLLKLVAPRYRYLVENEHFFLTAARGHGIPAPTTRIVHDSDGAAALAVSRFDRVLTSEGVQALPVEDGCQVLGLRPEAKYTVGTGQVLAALAAVCEDPAAAAEQLLAQVVFAYLSVNGDAHAKNFSILGDHDGRWRPSPAYDLPSTFFYGQHTAALGVAGIRGPNITGRRFIALAEQHLGLCATRARQTIDRVAATADHWLTAVDQLPFDRRRATKFRRVVRTRQQFLMLH